MDKKGQIWGRASIATTGATYAEYDSLHNICYATQFVNNI